MKKAVRKQNVKKVNKTAVAQNKKPLFEFHQLPIIIALLTVILSCLYVMSNVYMPKQQSEVYVLSGQTQAE